MQRKIDSKLSSLEFSSLLSIMVNIIAGLESIKEYKYVPYNILKLVENDIKTIKNIYYQLKSKHNLNKKYIFLKNDEIININTIFKIEEKYKPLIIEIWKKELSNLDNMNQTSNFLSLVHMVKDSYDISYVENSIYGNDNMCISTSLISNEKHYHYEHDKTNYGFIYDINSNNFLGACESDGQIIQINDSSEHNIFSLKSTNDYTINSLVYTYGNNFQMTLTKTPYNLFNSNDNSLFYNEVCLDKTFSKPIGIIYYKRENDDLTNEKVNYFANKYNLPVITFDYSYKNYI